MRWISNILFDVIGSLMGIVLIAAAFAHLVSPDYARGLLSRFAVPLLLLYVAVLLVIQMLWSADAAIYLFLVAASAAAYWVLRRRHSRREVGLGRGVQRTPIFPPASDGDDL